jgi:hypothetical protein
VREQPVMLKVLLREKHWQNYATFCAQYDKAAQRIDPDLMGRHPSRAQLHRWVNGEVRSLPYADHCRVLEEMFPGWTAEQMFQPANGKHPAPGIGAFAATALMSALPSTGLRPFIEQAFTAEHVVIDFAGFSGETLHGVIQEPLDRIRAGELKPASVTVRMLLPDTTKPMVLPCRVEDLADDPDFRARSHRLTSRHAYAILESVHELARKGCISQGRAQIRAHQLPPVFKMYILNGREAFFGLYPIAKHNIPIPGGTRDMYDLMGKDAMVFRYSQASGEAADAQFIEQAQTWFDSIWDTISYEYPA